MALTNALLKSFGLEQDQRDAVMAAHQETLESIKAERDELQDKAAQVPDLERQIEELKNAADDGDAWKSKYDELSGEHGKLQEDFEKLKGEKQTIADEHESYVKQVEAEKADAEKRGLYKALLREIGLDDKRVEKVAKLKNLDELAVEDGKLAGDEQCVRETASIAADHAQKITVDGRTVVPAGAVIPSNDKDAKGILYEPIDVTDGAMPGSIVTAGAIYGDKLPEALKDVAKTALAGISVKDAPSVTRP